MAFVFGRRLAIPLWAIAFFTVGLTAPALATFSLIAVLGIALMVFTIPGLVRASPSVVQLLLTGKRRTRSGATGQPDGIRCADARNWKRHSPILLKSLVTPSYPCCTGWKVNL